jgi:hypothetical protein
MIMIIDYRKIFGVVMVQDSGKVRVEQKVFSEEGILGLCRNHISDQVAKMRCNYYPKFTPK